MSVAILLLGWFLVFFVGPAIFFMVTEECFYCLLNRFLASGLRRWAAWLEKPSHPPIGRRRASAGPAPEPEREPQG